MTVGSTGLDPNSLLLASLYQTNQVAGTAATTVTGSTPAGTSSIAPVGPGDSAQISGPGQLLSSLQQLQQQDPAKFKEVTADIASKLQAAAQQTTGGIADFLTNLANKFQTASSTGSASGLQPHHHGHHGHHAHVNGTYNQQGQLLPGTSPIQPDTSTSNSSGVNLKDLFTDITKEVTQALGA